MADILYPRRDPRVLLAVVAPGRALRAAVGGLPCPLLYVVGGLVSLGLLVYLVVALLKPELFS